MLVGEYERSVPADEINALPCCRANEIAQIQKLINSRCFDSITLTLRDNSNKKSEASLPIAPYESNTNGTNTQPWLSGSVPYFSLFHFSRCSGVPFFMAAAVVT